MFLLRNCIGSLPNSFGLIMNQVEVSISLNGKNKKGDLAVGVCFVFLKQCILNCGEDLEIKILYCLTSYGINIVRNEILLEYNVNGFSNLETHA